MPDSFRYTFTDSVSQLLGETHSSLWVSTYQAGKLALFRANEAGKLSMLLRTFDKAMGFALDSQRLAIGTAHPSTTRVLNSGVYILGATLDTSGTIGVAGTGGGGTRLNHGVFMSNIATPNTVPVPVGTAGSGVSEKEAGNFFP